MKVFSISKAATVMTLASAIMLLNTVTSFAQSAKDKTKCAYVVKNLKLSKEEQGKFTTTFYAYLKERKQVRAIYEDLKDELKESIKNNTITAAQAQKLLQNRWIADEKELQVRKKYSDIFVKTLGAKKAFNVFRFANDKVE